MKPACLGHSCATDETATATQRGHETNPLKHGAGITH